MKKILVLGAGFVAAPLVRYLLDKGFAVDIATLLPERAEEMVAGRPNGRVVLLDVRDEAALSSFVGACDLAVSLLPFSLHVQIARLCISLGKHLVTTSYIAPAMAELDVEARSAGVTVLNEIGLDPGMDHMSAMQIFDGVRDRGGRVVSFRSYCGGLPAPDVNDNPFGYKFSWAPRGVLLAGRNGARYMEEGRILTVPPDRLFRDMHILPVAEVGDFEAYPNRDSIAYVDIYGLEGIRTLYRGTLRNMGWCDCLFQYGRLGLLSLSEVEVKGKTCAEFMRGLLECPPDADLAAAAASRLGIPRLSLPILNLEWLGLFAEGKFQADRISPLDALGERMLEKLVFRPGERDMVVLHHDIRVEYPDSSREHIISECVDFGVPFGDSAMSRMVSLPAAIAADRIANGGIRTRGVMRPVSREIYGPVLEELAALGIACREKREDY